MTISQLAAPVQTHANYERLIARAKQVPPATTSIASVAAAASYAFRAVARCGTGIGQRERCTTTLCFMNRSNRTPWVLDTCKLSLLKTL